MDKERVRKFKAMCTHPMCSGLPKTECIHCEPHPYDEETCGEVHCGMLEESSYCDIVEVLPNGTKVLKD